EDDLARDLGVEHVRVDNFSGRRGYAVLEIPRPQRVIPDVTGISREAGPTLNLALGITVAFEEYRVEVADLPQLLVAETTGSGKSVFLRSLLWQLTQLYAPDEVDLVVIDAKGMRDFSDFASCPHFKQQGDFHLGANGALEKLEEIVETSLPRRVADFNAYAD